MSPSTKIYPGSPSLNRSFTKLTPITKSDSSSRKSSISKSPSRESAIGAAIMVIINEKHATITAYFADFDAVFPNHSFGII